MFKLYIYRKSIGILSTVLIILLLGNTFAFAEDKYFLDFNGEYYVDLLSLNQNDQDESATLSPTNSSNSQSQNVSLRPAHKYLGYATAAFAGLTAVSSSSKGFHQFAGYTTAGLSLITTAIGFYEYGEYIDLDEGFTGYNMHMILESLATIGFIATAALQDENGSHAVIGGVSTALMILPIFVVHW